MRGRDNGLADYNTVRKCFGLPMINHFSEINQQQFAKHPDMFARLEEVYGGKITEHAKNIFIHHLELKIFHIRKKYLELHIFSGDMMNIDLYVGGMLESYGGPGPLFTKIIREQFERLRDADR